MCVCVCVCVYESVIFAILHFKIEMKNLDILEMVIDQSNCKLRLQVVTSRELHTSERLEVKFLIQLN
jgi:hypothetical protein